MPQGDGGGVMTTPLWPNERAGRRAMRWELALVLAISLGQSAVYAIVSFIASVTAPTPISQQTVALNPTRSSRQWLDFTNQFLTITCDLAVVALVLYLLARPGIAGSGNPFHRIGLDVRRFGRNALGGVALFAAIGVPGIALYAVGRLAGITVNVAASPLNAAWWTVPILVFSALRAALQEEVIVVGYAFTRLRELGVRDLWIILGTATLRGSYHLYQGVGSFVGNFVMGLVFGWCYRRWGRTMPLVVAHTLLDVASFVGYPLAITLFPHIFTTP